MRIDKLKNVITLTMGQSPSSESYNDVGEGLPFFQGKADFGKITPTVRMYCSQPSKLAIKNDILMSVRAPVGDVNISDRECCIGRGLASLRANEKELDYKYLYYVLSFKKEQIANMGTGSTFKAINKGILEEVEIPIPTLEAQKQIVNALDKAQELIDKRKEQIEACDKLIKSQFIEMFGDTVKNEKEWEIKQLQEIGTWKSGGTPSRSNYDYFKGDIDWYSAGELNQLYLEESIEKITPQAIEESSAKIFNKGSMLVGMYDTAAFKMGILKKDSASNQACANVMPNESVNIVWLYYNLMHMKEHFLSNRRGIRQKNLNLGMIKEFDIPVPPIELQYQFASFVQQVDKLKFEMEQSLGELENNFNSLMQRAFKGELF